MTSIASLLDGGRQSHNSRRRCLIFDGSKRKTKLPSLFSFKLFKSTVTVPVNKPNPLRLTERIGAPPISSRRTAVIGRCECQSSVHAQQGCRGVAPVWARENDGVSQSLARLYENAGLDLNFELVPWLCLKYYRSTKILKGALRKRHNIVQCSYLYLVPTSYLSL